MTQSTPLRHLAAATLLAVPAALAMLFSSVVGSSADGPIKLSLTPVGAASNFTLSMQPGETRQLEVRVANNAAEPVLARTFAADAYSMVNGGLGIRLAGEASSGTTTWVSYAAEDLDLAAGATVDREFSVTVPATTLPGEYLTSVVLQNAEAIDGAPSGQSDVVLKQFVRQVVVVSVDVPGQRSPALALGPITESTMLGRSTIDVAVSNTGNVRLRPSGELVLWDGAGKEVTRFPIAMDTVYAHTDTYAEVPFSSRLNPGDYTAEVNLTDASGLSARSGKRSFTVSSIRAEASSGSIDAPPARAQADQIPAPGTDSTGSWTMALIGFGVGLCLMLSLSGFGFAMYRRRRQR